MAEDHSKSYSGFGIRAIGHRARLKAILKNLSHMSVARNSKFCDLGCSNGYITEKIRSKFGLDATGMDHQQEHFDLGRLNYPDITFRGVDLNQCYQGIEHYDLVTCFETLEHVGNLQNGVQNVVSRISPGWQALISVPIEHGWRGILKYLVKKLIGGYDTQELGISEFSYLKVLLSFKRLSSTRPKSLGFGTHFGFDYRDVDECLKRLNIKYKAFNKGMTRFYILNN